MQDNVSVLIATIMAVIIIVLFPIYNIATRQDSIANNMVVKATTNFVDEVRNKGYVDKETYNEFLNELDKTGNRYDVEMEVYKPILVETASIDPNVEKEYEEKYKVDYTEKILTDMENTEKYIDEGSIKKSNVYYLYDGYKFYVRVKNTNVTQAQVLLGKLLGGNQDERIVVNYGGIVFSSEWQHGENAETLSANISISRPLYKEGENNYKEYKYGYVTDIVDEYTGETNTVYGIKVELSDEGTKEIYFTLKYTDVERLPGTTPEERAAHITNFVKTEGFEVDEGGKVVEEISYKDNQNGLWSYEYLIKISNINYNFSSNPNIEGRIKIEAGSAYTKAGALSEVNSKYFIIISKTKPPTVTLKETTGKLEDSTIKLGYGEEYVTLTFKAEANGIADIIQTVIRITGTKESGEGVDQTYSKKYGDGDREVEQTETADYEKGQYKVSSYAIDSNGVYSEVETIEFKVTKKEVITEIYEKKTLERDKLNVLTAPVKPGYRIIAYKIEAKLPNHTATDYYNVYAIKDGVQERILPSGKPSTTGRAIDLDITYMYHSSYNCFHDSEDISFNKQSVIASYYNTSVTDIKYFSDLNVTDYFKACESGTNSFLNTQYINCSNENYTGITFKYRIAPSHNGITSRGWITDWNCNSIRGVNYCWDYSLPDEYWENYSQDWGCDEYTYRAPYRPDYSETNCTVDSYMKLTVMYEKID